MKYALNLSADNRILSVTFSKYAPADAIHVDTIPEGNVADYIYENGEYVFSPITVEVPVEQQIAELKAELESTDYKVIKCYEAQLVGEEMPYDVVELHSIRQAIRYQINALEGGNE